MTFDFDALDMLGAALLPQRWIFAKTMPQNPHWYTLRKNWRDDSLFEQVVLTMRRVGYTEYYYGKPYTMVNINGMKYWTMGAPVNETILINRKHIDPPAEYDALAEIYEDMFTDAASLKENQDVVSMLDYRGGSVLDIGCGTGLLLDYLQPADYVGIDPSQAMLNVMIGKHPGAQVIKTLFEEYAGPKVDLVISLFGAANYVNPEAIKRIPCMVKDGGRWFVMFYKDDYYPVTYIKSGVALDHYKGSHLLLPGELSEFGNFWIVTGQK